MPGRGRPPKPDNLRAIDGGASHREVATAPGAEILAPVFAPAVPEMPAHVGKNEVARAEWDRVAPELHKAGFLTEAFAQQLAIYCVAVARWVEAETHLAEPGMGLLVRTPNGYPMQNPYLAISNKAMEQIRVFGSEFGMTPVALTRATRSGQGDLFDDPFEGYLNSGQNSGAA